MTRTWQLHPLRLGRKSRQLFVEPLEPRQLLATITVTTVQDDLAGEDGSVSLREAITAINAGNTLGDPDINAQSPGTFGTSDTINFNIPGAGLHTIDVGTHASALGLGLPSITKTVTINGYTQPGSSANTPGIGDNAVLQIELNGSNLGGGINGLTISGAASSGTTIRGLAINRFTGSMIVIDSLSQGNTIAGNFLGTNALGTAALPDAVEGVDVSGANNTIGGTDAADRNIISGNRVAGVFLRSATATGNFVEGNFIGTDASGTLALPNGVGIEIDDGIQNTIGGLGEGAANLISGNNNEGILLSHADSTQIFGNSIGTTVNGTDLGNGNAGIFVDFSANTLIGLNIIAFNGASQDTDDVAGIVVDGSTAVGNVISQNSIFSNFGLGIDLGDDGVTPNDPGDADTGPNNFQNAPVITSVVSIAGTTTIHGTLNSLPDTTFTIELFTNAAADPSGSGEGETFLENTDVTTDGSGNANFTFVISTPTGAFFTTTATRLNSDFLPVETSEFSGAPLPECEVTTLNLSRDPGTATLDDDADDPGQTVLLVTGTSANDVIVIEPRPVNRSQIRVKLNGTLLGIFASSDVEHIVVFGLEGNDTIVVNATLFQPATLFGDEGNDDLFGGRGNDQLDGGAGNDRLFGGAGNDLLCGGDGKDFLYGQAGNDFLGGDAGVDRLFGEAGDDELRGGDNSDFLYGGIGNDLVLGQAGNDQLFGENGSDILVGGEGNDKLIGGVGRDILLGGAGGDTLLGEGGDDILIADTTSADDDPALAAVIFAEWTSSNPYNVRVNNISALGITVSDDGDIDILFGQGGQDWFLVSPGDKIKDKAANELVN